ncbi:MAG: manganese catalase family protein [Ruminococcaceae bacterium]|nr:manganese catalase family protein [Oscillospiraceae bacterium]
MWLYEKKLQYPINIKNPDPRMARLIITAYGGADGELGAAVRYLSQRFSMPNDTTKAIANDIGSEELGHLEMVGTICHQLLDGADCQMLKEAGYDSAYVEHGLGVYPQDANGVPFTAAYLQSKGDAITDLTEDLAAEQKAKKMYEYLIDLTDDPDVKEPLRFLRAREIVHFQRFGEAMEIVKRLQSNRKYLIL